MIILSTAYFPPSIYFAWALVFGELKLEQCETYQKRSFRNRSYLSSPSGTNFISIPLKRGKHEQQDIREVEIAYENPWIQEHLQTLKMYYANAPYYDYYIDEIQRVLTSKPQSLFALNLDLLKSLINTLDLDIKISLTSSFKKDYINSINLIDLRNQLSSLNGLENWDKSCVNTMVVYPQTFDSKYDFIPRLSILDLLFNCGPESEFKLRTMSSRLQEWLDNKFITCP